MILIIGWCQAANKCIPGTHRGPDCDGDWYLFKLALLTGFLMIQLNAKEKLDLEECPMLNT